MHETNKICKDSFIDTNSLKSISDSEVRRLMVTKYGDFRDIKDLDMDDPIVAEFFDRAQRGR